MASIAIVGGGIAGLYCAWKLLDRPDRHSVTLYECLKRLGGRIETVDLEGFKAECGPMRFELEIEPLFEELTKRDLKITFGTFSSPLSGSAEFPKHNLQPEEVSEEHKQLVEKLGKGSHSEIVSGIFSHHTSALDLLRFGIYRMFHKDPVEMKLSLPEVLSGEETSEFATFAGGLKDEDYDRFRTEQMLDGVFLYTMGFWNALSRVLSPGAVTKIRDTGTFYHLMPENPSASEWAIFGFDY